MSESNSSSPRGEVSPVVLSEDRTRALAEEFKNRTAGHELHVSRYAWTVGRDAWSQAAGLLVASALQGTSQNNSSYRGAIIARVPHAELSQGGIGEIIFGSTIAQGGELENLRSELVYMVNLGLMAVGSELRL